MQITCGYYRKPVALPRFRLCEWPVTSGFSDPSIICGYAGGEPNISSHSYVWKCRFRSALDDYNFISSILLFLENEEALSLGPFVPIIKTLPQSFPWCISGFTITSPLSHSITSIRQERVTVTLRMDALLTIDLKLPAINSWWNNSPTELWIS